MGRATMNDLAEWQGAVTRTVEIVGVSTILLGGIAATVQFGRRWLTESLDAAYVGYRRDLGRAILLGLEFLVAADIINTVAVDPTFESVGVLAGIVAIRTFLSFSLDVEISGRWPWQRREGANVGADTPDSRTTP